MAALWWIGGYIVGVWLALLLWFLTPSANMSEKDDVHTGLFFAFIWPVALAAFVVLWPMMLTRRVRRYVAQSKARGE